MERLEQIGGELNLKLTGKKCKGMEGLIEEGKEAIAELDEENMDAGLIGAAQKVEHYEIAGYGTARTHAEMLGFRKVAKLLQQTLDEERLDRQEADGARRERYQYRDGRGLETNSQLPTPELPNIAELGVDLGSSTYLRISVKNSRARGSLDCPSQKIACFRTAGF